MRRIRGREGEMKGSRTFQLLEQTRQKISDHAGRKLVGGELGPIDERKNFQSTDSSKGREGAWGGGGGRGAFGGGGEEEGLHVFGEGVDVAGGGLVEEGQVDPDEGLTEGGGEGEALGGDGGVEDLGERGGGLELLKEIDNEWKMK